jgi:hypothetical protein
MLDIAFPAAEILRSFHYNLPILRHRDIAVTPRRRLKRVTIKYSHPQPLQLYRSSDTRNPHAIAFQIASCCCDYQLLSTICRRRNTPPTPLHHCLCIILSRTPPPQNDASKTSPTSKPCWSLSFTTSPSIRL